MGYPNSLSQLIEWTWPDIEPHYAELERASLDGGTVAGWLADWSRLAEHVRELHVRLYVATAVDTADETAATRYQHYLDEIYPPAQAAEQRLKEKLLASGLEPKGMAVPLRDMRAEAALFREANLPLLTEIKRLNAEHDQLFGAQTVTWEGQETTLPALEPVTHDPERTRREQAWRLAAERQLADREAVNELWVRYLGLRCEIAANAGLPDYRAYRWRELMRFDYSPADCERFHQAIEAVVVPAAQRAYERRRRRLGLDHLRPWDLLVDPLGRPPLQPFASGDGLSDGCAALFDRVDPRFGANFDVMRREGLLDLENRKHKAPGGFCEPFHAARRPFIFMNAVGLHNDVQTLLHEGGHAFHVFEVAALPYIHQTNVGAEFAEVASMAMELLASAYFERDAGGFYDAADAARARAENLEASLLFWPYMAVVDAFQHWVYTHAQAAMDPAECDRVWGDLWDRFRPGVDWSGLDDVRVTGWHRKLHIFQDPFYYVEYGLAQLGAVQIWAHACHDPQGAVSRYRHALALGSTAPLPDLYAAAGARLAFDAATLQEAVDLMEATIAQADPA